VIIGEKGCGKSTIIEKIFQTALTVTDGIDEASYYVSGKPGRFDADGSHLAVLKICDDNIHASGSTWLQDMIKTSTNASRSVEYKGRDVIECNKPCGVVFCLNGPFFLEEFACDACLDRFEIVAIPPPTTAYLRNASFKYNKLDRDTIINLALEMTMA
jgi:ABC-type dipeptide/oligopeptide/nickel transport system ATPase component